MNDESVNYCIAGTRGVRANGSQSDVCGLSRREFLATLAAFGLTAVTPVRELIAQTAASGTKRGLIDVHHHFVPPFYFSDNRERIAAAAGGRMHPAYARWTSEQTIAAMDKQNVATAVLSLTTPGVWFGEAKVGPGKRGCAQGFFDRERQSPLARCAG